MFSRKQIFLSALNLFLLFGNAALAKENSKTGRSRIGKNVTRREIGYFWHVSDLFFDPTYSPLAAPEDVSTFHTHAIDCHIKNAVNFTRNCGFFGELGQCSAFGLVETIARAMNSTRWKSVAPEFCIFTGNLRCPNTGNDRDNAIYDTMRAFITDIQNAGFVNVYPSYGWYDYYPHGHHPLKLTSLYDKVKNLLRDEKPDSSILASQLGPKTGYFSRVERPQNRIRVIVINTNFYLKNHIASRLPDPARQWRWLTDQLRRCRITIQKAFIVMSIPPGIIHRKINERERSSDNLVWSDLHNRRYIKIISEYHEVIAAQFAGHRHEDTFRLVYNREGRAVSTILLAPAINPSFGNYPAIRIYMYDKKNGTLLDYVQYYFNLTKANLEADMTTPEKYWELSYSFRDFYRLPDATTSSFEILVEKFWKNDVIFQRYHNNVEGFSHRKYTCEDRCRIISCCVITSIDLASFFECISGQFIANERRIKHSKPPLEALRDRLLVDRSTKTISASHVAVLPLQFFPSGFYSTVLFLLFVK